MFEFEFTGEEEQAVANLLGSEAAIRASAEQTIFGISEGAWRFRLGSELIGAAEHHLADQGFEGAAAGTELCGEMIEQRGMRGRLT